MHCNIGLQYGLAVQCVALETGCSEAWGAQLIPRDPEISGLLFEVATEEKDFDRLYRDILRFDNNPWDDNRCAVTLVMAGAFGNLLSQ